jgi:hypothetical protein
VRYIFEQGIQSLDEPVINPRVRPSTSSRSSKSSKKLSKPWTSVLLKAYKKERHSKPIDPMVKDDAVRHGQLGADGCSSGSIGVGVENAEEEGRARGKTVHEDADATALVIPKI